MSSRFDRLQQRLDSLTADIDSVLCSSTSRGRQPRRSRGAPTALEQVSPTHTAGTSTVLDLSNPMVSSTPDRQKDTANHYRDQPPSVERHNSSHHVTIRPEPRYAESPPRHSKRCSLSHEPVYSLPPPPAVVPRAKQLVPPTPSPSDHSSITYRRTRRLVSPACDSPRSYTPAYYATDHQDATPPQSVSRTTSMVDEALRESLRRERIEEERTLARLRMERSRLEGDVERCRRERDAAMHHNNHIIVESRRQSTSSHGWALEGVASGGSRSPAPRQGSAREISIASDRSGFVVDAMESPLLAPTKPVYRRHVSPSKSRPASTSLLTTQYSSLVPVTAAVVPTDDGHTMISVEVVVSREEVRLLPPSNPLDTICLPVGSLHLLYPFGSIGPRRMLPMLASVMTGVEARRKLIRAHCTSFARLGPGLQHRLYMWWVDKHSGAPMMCVTRFPNRKGFIRATLMILHAQNPSSTVSYGRCLWWLAAHLLAQSRVANRRASR